MNIKRTEKTEIKVIETYVSADGREWENKADCIEWEKGIKCVATVGWNEIPKKQVYTTDCGLPWSNEDEEAYIIIPRTHEDIVVIENYIKATTSDNMEISDLDIGKSMIFNFGYDHEWCSVYRIEQYLESLHKYYDNILCKMTSENQ